MSLDPRTPVLVGAGQVTDRSSAVPPGAGGRPPAASGLSPLELMVAATRAAAADAGAGGDALLARAQSVGVVDLFSWPVPDPGAALAVELGLRPAETVVSARGGNGPVALLGELAGRIAAGQLDVALLAGGGGGHLVGRRPARGPRPGMGNAARGHRTDPHRRRRS